MEKMKEVEKERREEDLVDVVGTLEGYKARPMEKEVSSVTPRMEDWMVALPKRRRLVELKLVLKMNSVPEVLELRITSVMVIRTRGRVGQDIRERGREREREIRQWLWRRSFKSMLKYSCTLCCKYCTYFLTSKNHQRNQRS